VIRTGMRQTGEWLTIDGGAMRIRCYQKGTAHLEIHPEMAWRLNSILAHIYPLAIPPEFRQKPKRKPKDIELTSRLLPFSVVSALQSAESASERVSDRNWRKLANTVYIKARMDKFIEAQVDQVLEQIGGVRAKLGVAYHYWQFDYDPMPVIGVICASGCVPDHKSHQYYPTPSELAEIAVAHASEGDNGASVAYTQGRRSALGRDPSIQHSGRKLPHQFAEVYQPANHIVLGHPCRRPGSNALRYGNHPKP